MSLESIQTCIFRITRRKKPRKILPLAVRRNPQSCTSGKAGGLICEPLKAVWPATPARFLFEHLQLIESTIFFLLLSDVISHLRLVPPHRRHVIALAQKFNPTKFFALMYPTTPD